MQSKIFILMVLICIGFIIAQEFNAPSTIYCPDITKFVVNIEQLESEYSTFGKAWYTLSKIDTFAAIREHITRTKCVKKRDESQTCRKSLRQNLVNRLKKHFSIAKDPMLDDIYYFDYISTENSSWSVHTKRMAGIGCFAACLSIRLTKDWSYYCWDPCRMQISCDPKNCTSLGIYNHQFRCKCPRDHEWDGEIYRCLTKQEYHIRRGNNPPPNSIDLAFGCAHFDYCNSIGTLFCEKNYITEAIYCTCKPQYRGSRCTEPVNACFQRVSHPHLPNHGTLVAGNEACNVNLDENTCTHETTLLGDVSYRCTCNRTQWEADVLLPYDNCLRQRSLCDYHVCVYGRCLTTVDGSQSHCLCQPEYAGHECLDWVGLWGAWSPWDSCRPVCGEVRLSLRHRDCLSSAGNPSLPGECVGSAIEYQRCAQHPCSHGGRQFGIEYFVNRQQTITNSIMAAMITSGLLTITWVYLFRQTAQRIAQPYVNRVIARWRNS